MAILQGEPMVRMMNSNPVELCLIYDKEEIAKNILYFMLFTNHFPPHLRPPPQKKIIL